jgi:hypothetical protein
MHCSQKKGKIKTIPANWDDLWMERMQVGRASRRESLWRQNQKAAGVIPAAD